MGLQNASNDDMICRILHDEMTHLISPLIINNITASN